MLAWFQYSRPALGRIDFFWSKPRHRLRNNNDPSGWTDTYVEADLLKQGWFGGLDAIAVLGGAVGVTGDDGAGDDVDAVFKG